MQINVSSRRHTTSAPWIPSSKRQKALIGRIWMKIRSLQALDSAGLLVRIGKKYVSKAPIRSSVVADREYLYRIRASILDQQE